VLRLCRPLGGGGAYVWKVGVRERLAGWWSLALVVVRWQLVAVLGGGAWRNIGLRKWCWVRLGVWLYGRSAPPDGGGMGVAMADWGLMGRVVPFDRGNVVFGGSNLRFLMGVGCR